MEQIRSGLSVAAEEVKEQMTQVARTVVEAVRGEAERILDERRDAATARVGNVANAVDRAAHALHAVRMDSAARLAERASNRVEQASQYVKESNMTQVIEDAQELARRHRALAVGGMFLTGLVVARLVKATAHVGAVGGGRRGRSSGARRSRAGALATRSLRVKRGGNQSN